MNSDFYDFKNESVYTLINHESLKISVFSATKIWNISIFSFSFQVIIFFVFSSRIINVILKIIESNGSEPFPPPFHFDKL